MNSGFRSVISACAEVAARKSLYGGRPLITLAAGTFTLAISLASVLAQQPGNQGAGISMAASDTCKPGFVWREAVKSDHVCVSPQTRARTRAENETAGQRAMPGSDGCRQGYVWREAVPTDHVCVAPQSRAAASDDNH